MGFCDGGLCQKAAVWTKSGHTLPLLCTASESSLGPPWWHISPCHRPFPSTLSLPREIWLDLTEWCHWYTLQQSYINLPKLQSITLCKAASAIWIAEMEKKKFYSLYLSQGSPFLSCLSVSQVNRACIFSGFDLGQTHTAFPKERGICPSSTNTDSSEVCTLSKKKQFGTSQTFSSR